METKLYHAVVLAVLVAASIASATVVKQRYDASPEQIHVAFGPDLTTYVIGWLSFEDVTSQSLSLVQYGTSPTDLSLNTSSVPFTFVEQECSTRRAIHNVAIGRIQPGSTVYYRVASAPSYIWSQVYNIYAIQTNQLPLVFSAFGDMESPNKNPARANSVPAMIKLTNSREHHFVFHAGDIAYNMDDNCAQVADEFMNSIQPISAYVPYMFCPGNHETERDYSYLNYLKRTTNQEPLGLTSGSAHPTRYFSFDISLIHFIAIDTDAYIYPQVYELAEPQWNFVRDDLAKVDRTKTPWIIIFGHRAMYCSYESLNECGREANAIRLGKLINREFGMEELLMQYGVDVYLAGHTHHYESSWPTFDSQPVQKDYNNPRAPVHILSGHAGVDSNDEFGPEPPAWAKYRDETYRMGWGVFKLFNATHLLYEQRDAVTGEPYDSVLIVQQNHGPFKK